MIFKRRYVLFSFFLTFFGQQVLGQIHKDSVFHIKEIVIKSYLSPQPLLSSPASVSVLNEQQINRQSGNSLVPLLNTVSGVRMEERSPGSYRLSLRGSLLRAPFGVRNVKIYMDEFPLTDASGNTYLNGLDIGAIGGIEILKGPDGSLFGANSGGVVLINPRNAAADSTALSLRLNGGSYGLFHEILSAGKQWKNYGLNISQSFQRSDGYRQNSMMRRHYIQANQHWNYYRGNTLKLLTFYSDLYYQTPGGLTAVQFSADPRSARPATAKLPGAVAQQAGIYTKTFFGGLAHEAQINSRLRHVLAIFGSTTKFDNPFITNYESREEHTAGVRTFIELTSRKENSFKYQWNAGLEWQKTNARISNFGNRLGIKDTIQAADRIQTDQHFFFTRFNINISEKLTLEAALSLNAYQYQFSSLSNSPNPYSKGIRKFSDQLMPRMALSYRLTEQMALRASVSRGYSTPTNSEVRSTDNIINTALEAENGWNYETGIRLRDRQDRLYVDASVFYYRLRQAIVKRTNNDETEYFLNAGGTKQLGFESQVSYWIIEPGSSGFLKGLQIQNALTWSSFHFSDYQNNLNYALNNALTGVPKTILVTGLHFSLPKNLYAFLQHNYTSRIPLNDGNTVFAKKYNLLQLKAGWQQRQAKKANLEIYAGADNLLNEVYSLGNDLNPVGNRYFNAAATRNFYAGVNLRF
ncbi:MAG: TonB-dependent receptor [Sphingobacteriaceae bacterium]